MVAAVAVLLSSLTCKSPVARFRPRSFANRVIVDRGALDRQDGRHSVPEFCKKALSTDYFFPVGLEWYQLKMPAYLPYPPRPTRPLLLYLLSSFNH